MGILHAHFSDASLFLNELIKPQLWRQILISDLHYRLLFHHTRRKCTRLKCWDVGLSFQSMCVCVSVWVLLLCTCRDTGDVQIRLDSVDAARPGSLCVECDLVVRFETGCEAALGSVMGEGTYWQWQWGGNGAEWGGMVPVRHPSQWCRAVQLCPNTAKWILLYTYVGFFSAELEI